MANKQIIPLEEDCSRFYSGFQHMASEWSIYPSLYNRQHYALGAPDGNELRDGQLVEIYLGGYWIPGYIERRSTGDIFMAIDHTVSGLCSGMKVRIPTFQMTIQR